MKKLKLINEQLVYDIGGNTMKSAWELVKKNSINNFLQLLNMKSIAIHYNESPLSLVESMKIITFFKKTFPNSSPYEQYGNIKTKFVLNLKDVKGNLKIKNGLFDYYILFTNSENENNLASFNWSPNPNVTPVIIINVLSVPFLKHLNVLRKNIINNQYDKAKNLIYYLLKIIYSSFKHEMIHYVDHINKITTLEYTAQSQPQNRLEYFSSEIEFPTILSNLHSFFKRVVAKKRKKITYKSFFNYLLYSEIKNFKYNIDPVPNVLPFLRENNFPRFKQFSKRLFIAIKDSLLQDDGTPIPQFLR